MVASVKVIHGANDGDFALSDRTPISVLRASLIDAFNIPGAAVPFPPVSYLRTPGRRSIQPVSEGMTPAKDRPRLPLTEYGTIDITEGVPEGLVHVDLPRLGPTCKRIGIEYGKAIVDWTELGRKYHKKSYPLFSGVVIRAVDHARLMAALEEKAKQRQRKVDRLSVLAALFTLNRRAKRCRDLAQTYYQNGMHGFAGDMKREKNRIYDLKGQVLHYLVESGVLVGGKYHRFEFGNWAEVLESDGYRFHRPCPPQESAGEAELVESVEAKPKEAKEPSLDIAYEVVTNFLKDKERVPVYEWPPVVRSRRYRWEEEDEFDDDDEWEDDMDGRLG